MKAAAVLPRALALALVAGASALACAPETPPPCLEDVGDLAWPGLRHVVAARVDGGVRVRGFSGAVPSGGHVTFDAGGEQVSIDADERGRFDISISIDTDAVHLTTTEGSATLRVRSLEEAFSCVAAETAPVGTTPNDLVIGRCGSDALALVPTSGDGALESVSLTGGSAPGAAAFPIESGKPPNPWGVSLHEDGALAAVTLFGLHAVALVDVCAGTTLHIAEALADEGVPLLVEVNPPVTLAYPLDADGDGVEETRVTRMRPRHPEGVAFVGNRLLVSYTNLLEVGPPARFGPGLVVAFELEGKRLRPAGFTLLPFQNPQSIRLDDEGQPWASCSGVLERGLASMEASSDGGLVRLDSASLEITRVVELGRFAPGTPAITREGIVVGSLLEGTLTYLPREASTLADGRPLSTGARGTESLFDVLAFGGGLAFATGFTTDALVAVDLAEGTLHPWPFEHALPLGPGGEVFRGLKAIAAAPFGTRARGAPDAAALLALSSEVVPLRFWQVMGP